MDKYKEKLEYIIKELIEEKTSTKEIIDSFKEISINKRNIKLNMLNFIITIIFSIIIIKSNNTMQILNDITSKIITLEISIFSVIFIVHYFILSLLKKDYIKSLIDLDGGKDMLIDMIRYNVSILFLYFIGIIISLIINLFTNSLDLKITLSNNLKLDNFICFLILFFYFLFNFRICLEIKSIIYNNSNFFKFNIASKLIEILKNYK